MTLMTTTGADRIISDSTSWLDFQSRLLKLAEKEKGDTFERLVQLFFLTDPTYSSLLSNVWRLEEVPAKIRKHLNLPIKDYGIDLIAETNGGEYWSIQAKYRTDRYSTLTYGDVSTFTTLTYVTCENIAWALVCSTSSRPISNKSLISDSVGFLSSDTWLDLDEDGGEGWRLIKSALEGSSTSSPTPTEPLPFQKECLDIAEDLAAASVSLKYSVCTKLK